MKTFYAIVEDFYGALDIVDFYVSKEEAERVAVCLNAHDHIIGTEYHVEEITIGQKGERV